MEKRREEKRRKTQRTILILVVAAIVVYGFQILIFHDPETTAFYIFQDMAFIPISIAITTVVVGQILDAQEKKDSRMKTRMLKSSFFTGLGVQLMGALFEASEVDEEVLDIVLMKEKMDPEEAMRKLRVDKITIDIGQEDYCKIRSMVRAYETELLVISSNPLLLDQEDFTYLLYGIFHLIDEFRLRGDYENLSSDDIEHFNDDFCKVLRLLLLNWIGNIEYLHERFPNFYNASRDLMEARSLERCTHHPKREKE